MADTVVDEYILFRFSKLYRDDATLPDFNVIIPYYFEESLVFRAQVIVDNEDVTITSQVIPKEDVNNI